MHRYSIYKKEDQGVIEIEQVEFDLLNISKKTTEKQRRVLDLTRDRKYWVAPHGPESAWFLMKPRKTGSAKITPEIVLLIHRLRVEKNFPTLKIALEVEKQTNVNVSIELVKNILKQRSHIDILLPDKLREKVLAADRIRNERSKIDDTLKRRIYRKYKKDGKSGTQIAREEGLTSSAVNRIIRQKYGYRKESYL